MNNRRSFLQSTLGLGAAWLSASKLFGETGQNTKIYKRIHQANSGPAFNMPVVTTDIGDMPYTMDGNTKVFHLTAEVVKQKISSLKTIDAWGFNGSAPGPTIQVNQGDHVRVVFENRLPEQTSIHWHGFEDTIQNDGQPGISQEPVKPGGRFVYEFNPGDWMIHCHLPHHMMNQMSSNAGKMTRTAGMPAGGDMNTGMGMLKGTPGAPMGEDYGPALGRGLGGVGNAGDTSTTNGPLSQKKAMDAMPGMQHDMGSMQMGQMAQDDIAKNANDVPNFPQDAYMEGPMMAMDQMVDRPENYGLRAGWSGFMQGMMTFVRVLPPDKYDEVIARMKQAKRSSDPYSAILERA